MMQRIMMNGEEELMWLMPDTKDAQLEGMRESCLSVISCCIMARDEKQRSNFRTSNVVL